MREELKIMHDLFSKHGHKIRAVGGCVRDHLIDVPSADVDFATTATPEQMLEMEGIDGWRVLKTGLDHGTVTFMSLLGSFEVTTLRKDVETDGRHAIVEFTDDWEEDAKRRDLTINAMYFDHEQGLIDYFGGQEDLLNGRVKFVGNAEERIKEDFLRMIRFFRFYARFGKGEIDKEARFAITKHSKSIQTVSVERIWKEIKSAAKHDKFLKFWTFAGNHGMFDVGYFKFNIANYNTSKIGVTREFLPECPEGCIATTFSKGEHFLFADSFKLSAKERDNMVKINELRNKSFGINEEQFFKEQLFRGFSRLQLKIATRAKVFINWDTIIDNIEVPVFPINGHQLRSVGVPQTETMGQIRRFLVDSWIDSDFKLKPNTLLEMAKDVL